MGEKGFALAIVDIETLVVVLRRVDRLMRMKTSVHGRK